MNVSFSSFQVVCYWGTWANYRPEGGDKTCFQKNEIVIACLLLFWHLILSAPNFQENSLLTTLMPPSAHISSTGSSALIVINTPRNWFTRGLFFCICILSGSPLVCCFVFVFYLVHLIPFAVLPALTLATGR